MTKLLTNTEEIMYTETCKKIQWNGFKQEAARVFFRVKTLGSFMEGKSC